MSVERGKHATFTPPRPRSGAVPNPLLIFFHVFGTYSAMVSSTVVQAFENLNENDAESLDDLPTSSLSDRAGHVGTDRENVDFEYR